MKFKSFACRCVTISLLTFAGGTAAEIQIVSATNITHSIGGAEVYFEKNGWPSPKNLSSSDGSVPFAYALLDDAEVTMTVKMTGYSDLIVQCPCDYMTYAMSPLMPDAESIRIVLTSRSRDFNSGLYSLSNGINVENVGQRAGTNNGYTPKTTTLTKRNQGKQYVYAVHPHDPISYESSAISESDVMVFVYKGTSLVRSYIPPFNLNANTWVVFGIDSNGDIKEINQLADIGDRRQLHELLAMSTTTMLNQATANTNRDSEAIRLNNEGMQNYLNGAYSIAEENFRQVTHNNPWDAQAYNNLALTYIKLGKSNEALLTSQRAINLAKGRDAYRLKADAYYNMARIYETASNWSMALNSYHTAEQYRDDELYREGLARTLIKLDELRHNKGK